MRILLVILAALAVAGAALPGAAAERVLKVSHQWPGGRGDARDEMARIIKRELQAADVGLRVQIYPGKSLFKPHAQWNAMVGGQLDISIFPLAYAAGQHPQFDATLMPGLVKNHEHARRLNGSAFMDDIKRIMGDAGVVVLADAWLAGGFVSGKNCILDPADARGQVLRAAGKSFEEMLIGAGASIASMPSSEIYTAMQTGVLDGANTSSASLVSFRIYEQAECLTEPGDNALWFMYEPILMSARSFERLDARQRAALMRAGKAAEEYFFAAARGLDEALVAAYKKAGVRVVRMSAAQAAAWREIANRTSYKNFADNVPGGGALIEKALSVD